MKCVFCNQDLLNEKKLNDAYALLADVRADINRVLLSEIEIANNGDRSTDRIVGLARIIEKIDKVREHFR